MRYAYILPLIVLLYGCKEEVSSHSGFRLLSSSETGVTFTNALKPDVSTRHNLLDYDYYYNGAGVGIADLDGDGLEDLVFAANEGQNELYRNLGNLRFENVTEGSGLDISSHWSNGVAIADVNADGLLDVYISQGGPGHADGRANLLYINRGNMRFEESAVAMGLADQGISTQSVFLDYDRDGDLDCYVMNESELYGYDIIPYYRQMLLDDKVLYDNSSHLYRNDEGVFTDVSAESGILQPSFGLGLCVLDVNEDGFVDIYQANDYYVPDRMWINQGDGTFSDELKARTGHISFYGMGVDAGDIDADGHEDLVVLDMASADHKRAKTLMASMDVQTFDMMVDDMELPYQYMYNTVQLRNRDGSYDDIAQLTGLAKTDWSWAPLMLDYDLDGYQDFFITNGYRKYALDNDFRQKVVETQQEYQGKVPLAIKQDLYESIPEEPLRNLLYRQVGPLQFEERGSEEGMNQATYSNGASYADLDLDGDLDMVVHHIDATASIYENLSYSGDEKHYLSVSVDGPTSESFARVTVWVDGRFQSQVVRRVRGYRSSVSTRLIFGLADHQVADKIEVRWPDGRIYTIENVKADQHMTVQYADSKEARADKSTAASLTLEQVSLGNHGLYYKHQEDDYDDLQLEILLPYRQSKLGPSISRVDINDDGLHDLWCGATRRSGSVGFVQQSDGTYEKLSLWSSSDVEEADAAFFDIDGDGDLDAYVVHGGNEYPAGHESYADRLYINDSGNYRLDTSVIDLSNKSSSRVLKHDLEADGDMDLIVLDRILPQSYPQGGAVRILINDEGKLRDQSRSWLDGIQISGMPNDALITERGDLIIVGEWMAPLRLRVDGDHLTRLSLPTDDKSGWWFSVGQSDLNGDGYQDLVLGNLGLNSKYQASPEKPLRVYGADMDQSGSYDVVLSQKYEGEFVPFRGKECSSDQMPFIDDKFPSYAGFADASLSDIYGSALDSAYVSEVVYFKSVILWGSDSEEYRLEALPIELQQRPILDMSFADIDGDGLMDCLPVGNIYETEPETPRLDASSQYVLLHSPDGLVTEELPYFTKGDVKSIAQLEVGSENILVVGSNDELLTLYKIPN